MFGEPYSEEQIEFIKVNYPLMNLKSLTDLFNRKFKDDRSQSAINGAIQRRKISSGRSGRWEKGNTPYNKGKKRPGIGSSTRFKPGNVPPNTKPLYHERVDSKDGYILIKIPRPDKYTPSKTRYVFKHVWLWEQINGPVPKGKVLVFKDGDIRNITIENLMAVTRLELLMMNKHRYKQADDDLKPSIAVLSKLEALTIEKKNRRKNTDENQEEGQSEDNQDQHWQDCEGQGKNSKKDAGQLQEQPA